MISTEELPTNDDLFLQVYEDLRRLARGVKGSRGNVTWNPTALVHEAYVRLTASGRFRAESAEHLKHTVVRAVKYLIIEAARRNSASRRGGGVVPMRRIPLDDLSVRSAEFDPEQLLALTEALDGLAKENELRALIFDYRYFGGLELSEIASLLKISEKKVQRSLRLARASVTVALGRKSIE